MQSAQPAPATREDTRPTADSDEGRRMIEAAAIAGYEDYMGQRYADASDELQSEWLKLSEGQLIAAGVLRPAPPPAPVEPVKTEHTPTPWEYQENSDAYTHIIRGPGNYFIVQFGQDTSGLTEANARHVVECVNRDAHQKTPPAPDNDEVAYWLAQLHDWVRNGETSQHLATKIAEAVGAREAGHQRELKDLRKRCADTANEWSTGCAISIGEVPLVAPKAEAQP